MEPKVIVIDWGIVSHSAIYASVRPGASAGYMAVSILIGLLYKLDVDPDDTIIVAMDGRNSWRKDYEGEYKADRKEKRAASGIDWDAKFAELQKVADEMNNGLNIHFLKFDRIEADDVMAVICRFYKDQPVVLATHDKDLEQCWNYPNVKIFSTKTKKWKIKPETYDYNVLIQEKIYKETTDNLVTPILTDADYEQRRMLVDLMKLPEWVEGKITDALKLVKPKPDDVYAIRYQNLHPRYANMFNDKSKVVDYDKQILKEASAEARKIKKDEEIKKKAARATAKEAKKVEKLKAEQAKLEAKIKLLKEQEKENGNKTLKNRKPEGCVTA